MVSKNTQFLRPRDTTGLWISIRFYKIRMFFTKIFGEFLSRQDAFVKSSKFAVQKEPALFANSLISHGSSLLSIMVRMSRETSAEYCSRNSIL